MDTQLLIHFLAVAKAQNISKAAKQLHLSQSNLSRQMAHLEEELGVSLFIKTNRHTLLTNEGQRLVKRAQEIIALEKKMRLEFQSHQKDIYGQINIGAGETVQFDYIARATKRVKEKYPHIEFNFYSGNSEDIVEKLNQGLLEFGLLLEPVNTQNLQTFYLPTSEPLGLLVHQHSPYYHASIITLKDLKDIPLILSRKAIVQLDNSLIAPQKDLNIVATCNLSYNAEFLVEHEVGCFLSIYKHYYQNFHNLRFIPLEKQFQKRWLIVCKSMDGLSEAHQIFLDALKEILSNASH